MNYAQDLLANTSEVERGAFYQKTYMHVAGAVLAFMGLEYVLLGIEPLVNFMLGVKGYGWLMVLGVFYLITMMGDRMAANLDRTQQYIGLGLYVLAYALLFVPMLYIAANYSSPGVISQAAIVTLALFGGLTAVAMTGKRDFSFLRTGLIVGGFIAIGLIVAGVIFGFNLGLWFSVGMVVLSAGSILYQTSQLRYRYHTSQYVAAAVGLFSSLMLLFWYVLRIFMSRD